MKSFVIFAIVVTIIYVIYYTVIIVQDLYGKPKDEFSLGGAASHCTFISIFITIVLRCDTATIIKKSGIVEQKGVSLFKRNSSGCKNMKITPIHQII